MVEEVVSSSKRFRFDPRAVAYRQTKLLSELNIDDLREASNNSAGILCYLPSKPDPEHEEPDVSDSFVAKEITVTQEETTELIIPVLPPTLPELAENFTDTEEYYIEVCRPLVCSIVDSETQCQMLPRNSLLVAARLITEGEESLLVNC